MVLDNRKLHLQVIKTSMMADYRTKWMEWEEGVGITILCVNHRQHQENWQSQHFYFVL